MRLHRFLVSLANHARRARLRLTHLAALLFVLVAMQIKTQGSCCD